MAISNKSPQGKEQEEGRGWGKREKTDRKLSEAITRVITRGQNELIGELLIAAAYVIVIAAEGGEVLAYTYIPQKIRRDCDRKR